MKRITTDFEHEKWIEVQSLIKNANEHYAQLAPAEGNFAEHMLASLLRCIESAPAGEVAPPAHWILEDENGHGVCSHCHRQDDIDPLATHCRYCGAKMDLTS